MLVAMSRVAVGIGLRDEYVDELLRGTDRATLDVLEILIDGGLEPGRRRTQWRRLGAKWPLVAHGTNLGVADAEGVDPEYVAAVQATVREVRPLWYSEHLAFVRAGGIELGHFGPVDADPETLDVLRVNAACVRDGLRCPFVLENAADVLGFGGADGAARGRAFARALEVSGSGALLDLTNAIYDARNEGFDVADYLDNVPWWRVVQLHLAGGCAHDGLWIDGHSARIDAEALTLLPEVARRAPNLRAVIIERDEHLPPLVELLDEVQEVRIRLAEAGRR